MNDPWCNNPNCGYKKQVQVIDNHFSFQEWLDREYNAKRLGYRVDGYYLPSNIDIILTDEQLKEMYNNRLGV